MIDEPSHPRVRAARRLHSASGRHKAGRFLAEGVQAVREALSAPGVVLEVFATPDWVASGALPTGDARVHVTSDPVLATLAQTTTPQGVVAVCRDVTIELGDLLARRPRLLVVLAEVRDPGNAGTIVRTADAAGADGVITTTATVDLRGGKAVRSSVGSLFHLPLVVGQPPTVPDDLRAAGLTVLAADGSGALDLYEAGEQGLLTGPTAWVVGNEAHGVAAGYLARVDAAVRVPMYGRAESLNVSVAAALCLFASAAAHRAAPSEDEGMQP